MQIILTEINSVKDEINNLKRKMHFTDNSDSNLNKSKLNLKIFLNSLKIT